MQIEERKHREEIAEWKRQEEIRIKERRHQEEIKERRRKEEYEERKRKDEMILVAQKLKLKPVPAVNKLYGFGNQRVPALKSIGRIKADVAFDKLKGKEYSLFLTMSS
ncbi:hypothetical protein AVEN_154974-1 [Araneus ventricosus]|uniref:Uncharacterized protein n=1 Tax=Araneus ventricosus TaxID=182803 RepID=A0A4Y2A8B1_ARAVE|nr:hypothetical protein AVEN_154974-1 [Araneus ventricosus]